MFIDSVQVFANGTINGNVCHQSIGLPVEHGIEYTTRTFSGGVGHSKHVERKHVCGDSGQDVHGHTPLSIYVSDGHGSAGFLVASSCTELATTLESRISVQELLSSPRALEYKLRQSVVEFLLGSQQSSWQHSGATFVQMVLMMIKMVL